MDLRRLFARAKPDSTPERKPRGGSGRFHTDGFLEYDEIDNLDLAFPASCRVYDRMWRSFADVRRAWGMWCNPIIAGTWTVEPYGGDDATDQDRADAELVHWALFDHLRGGLNGHLAEALPVLRHGFAPFEDIWHPFTYDGEQLLVPEYLGLRLPRSVTRFMQDDREQLAGIEQLTLNQGLVEIPASGLVYYRVGAEGDNWEGTSPLRAVYRNFFFLDGIEKLDAIAQERHAVGIPVVYPPSNASSDPETLEQVEDMLAGMRGGETAYILMPGPKQDTPGLPAGEGWFFEMQGMGSVTQGGRDAQPSLRYHTDKIAAGLIAEFMRLGQSGEGARATADVQQDPFYVAVEGFACTIVEPPLQTLAERIVRVNRGERAGYPRVRMSLVDATSLTELADYVQKLRTSEALQADDPLEDYLREKADLPPADPQERERRRQQREQMEQAEVERTRNPQPPAGEDEPPAGRRTASRQTRPLRHWERHMSLDTIEEAVDGARARFQAAGADAARAEAKRIAAAIANGKEPAIEASDALVDALATVLADLYATGRRTVAEELDRQAGKTGADYSQKYSAEIFRAGGAAAALRRRARAAAQAVAAAIVKRILGLDLQRDDATEAELQTAGEQAANAALKAEATLHAAPALNAGRADEADEQTDRIRGSRYTSILDGNRCDRCAAADDDVLRPLTDPVRVARKPPNRDCEGGDRCRCLEFFQLEDERPPSA